MKVSELIKKLVQMDKEKEIIIKFALDKEDEIGYVLQPIAVYQLFNDDVVIAGSYEITKEDCDFIGQLDLKEAINKATKFDKAIEMLERDTRICSTQDTTTNNIIFDYAKKTLKEMRLD
jgi:hypothetical protein